MRRLLPVGLMLLAACRAAPAPEPVPHPQIEELEQVVRERLGEARAVLDAAIAGGASGAALGEVYGETGMLYHAYDLRQAAAACYRNAVRLAPEEFRWAYYLGHVYSGAGDLERAREQFQRALALRPDDSATLVRLGRLELERDRPDLAEPRFRRVLELRGNAAAAHVGLGKIAAASGDPSSAVEHFETARELAPQATKILHPLGLAYRSLGRLDEAARLLARRGEVPVPLDDPWIREVGALSGGMRVHQIQGTLFFQEGQYERALQEFRRAVEQEPDEPLVRANLALTLVQLDDPEGAEREFLEALRLAPDDPFANYNYGTLLTNLGRDEEAVARFGVTLEQDPGQHRAQLNLANALARLGRLEEALPHYRAAIEGDPAQQTARLAEGRALARLGRWPEVRERLEQAYEAAPDSVAVRLELARLLAAAPDDTVRDGRRAMALTQPLVSPEMPLEHIETLAMIAAENGMFPTAVELQQRAVRSVREAGLEQPLPRLLRNLEAYRAGRACRAPWPRD